MHYVKSIKYHNNFGYEKIDKMKIDFVVPFVDDCDVSWQEEYKKYYKDENKILNNVARFRSFDNFHFFFRSVEKYASFVNQIFVIVASESQIPDFLDLSHPKLKIILHKDFIPKEFLPTFSSPVIELNLHRINDLSENFVLFNDDLFLNNLVFANDFFDEKTRQIKDCLVFHPLPSVEDFFHIELNTMILISNEFNKQQATKRLWRKLCNFKIGFVDLILNILNFPYKKFSNILSHHLTTACNKSDFIETWQMYEKQLNKSCIEKFRTKNTISRFLVRNRSLLKGDFVVKNMRKFGKNIQLNTVDINFTKYLSSTYKVLCFNDDRNLSNDDFQIVKQGLLQALTKKFPQKSSFER